MPDQEPEQIAVPVEWHVPEDLPCEYATNMVVQHTEHEFVISFFQAAPPLITGTPEEQRAQLERLGYVRAECVARIIIAAGRMPEFLHVLQTSLETFRLGRAQPQEQ